MTKLISSMFLLMFSMSGYMQLNASETSSIYKQPRDEISYNPIYSKAYQFTQAIIEYNTSDDVQQLIGINPEQNLSKDII